MMQAFINTTAALSPARRCLFRLGQVLCCLALLAPSAQAQSSPAPLAAASLTMPDMPLHDPFIFANAADHTYYLYTSNIPRLSGTPGVGTMVYRSSDLQHWAKPVIVFIVPPDAFGNAGGWAPEVHLFHGRYLLFTTIHDESKHLDEPPAVPRLTHRRGTMVAVSDQPEGPFQLVHLDAPVAPADFMTLDGTLYVDPHGKPWMVYAHEWVQKTDGTMEAVPLKDDLSAADGSPLFLFKASDAPWLDAEATPSKADTRYVTDGPELFRTRDGHLLMLWSSYGKGGYIQTVARSRTGDLRGPWEQLPPLIRNDSGHGMLFRSFDGHLLLVLHHPFRNARGRVYEMRDAGDHLEVVRERIDLDMAQTPITAEPPGR